MDPAPFIAEAECMPSSKRLDDAVMAKNYSHLDLGSTRFLDELVQHGPLWAGLVAKMVPVAGPDVAKCADVNYGCINTAVSFHVDMPLHNNVFGALFLDGPERTLRFSEMDLDIEVKPGTFVLFDPAQPHGLLAPGAKEFIAEGYIQKERIRMLSLCLPKTPQLCESLGMEVYNPFDHQHLPHTMPGYSADKRTGALPYPSLELDGD